MHKKQPNQRMKLGARGQKYGVMPWTVRKWRDHYLEFGANAFQRGFSATTKKTPHEVELEKENAASREEVEILKKAAAFLANVKHKSNISLPLSEQRSVLDFQDGQSTRGIGKRLLQIGPIKKRAPR